MASNSQLSAADQAAVLKAAQAGGLKDATVDSSGNVSASNSATKTGVNPQSGEAVGNQNTSIPTTTYAGFAAIPGESQADYYARYDARNNTSATPTPLTVTSQKDNPNGTSTNTLSDGSQDTGTYSKNTDSTLTFNPQANTQTGNLTMPANGSVVDLLNAAGQDSSFAARSALAQQYGIQNYTGTAAQNTQLAQKYQSAYNAAKGGAVPQNSADARSAIQSLTDDQASQGDPTQQFMDAYSSMNPIEANIFQQLSGLLATSNTKTSLVDTYTQLAQAQGLPELNLQLANINTIMSGTEDDIRSEITNSGGFATESQVQALTTSRNKTLLTQAQFLQNTINSKQDYVDRIVSLTQADQEQVSKDLDQKLGIANTLVSMSENMTNAAKDNIKTIVSSVGWTGLAQSLSGSPQQTAQVEQMFGLAPGGLNQLGIQEQLYKEENADTSVVTAGGEVKLINSKSGETIKNLGASSSGTTIFSPTQVNTGAAHAGMSATDFKTLPTDVQNTFISNADTGDLIVQDISSVKDGSMSRADALDDINNANLPQDAKDYFISLLPAASTQSTGGGFWNGIANFFGF